MDGDKIASRRAQASYSQRSERFGREEQGLARWDVWLSRLRVMVFFSALACFGIGWSSTSGAALWHVTGGLLCVGFVILVGIHDHVERRRIRCRALCRINEQGVARRLRRWDDLPAVPIQIPASHAAISTDLDLFGRTSLYQIACTAGTLVGRETVRDWLLETCSPDEVRLRQQAVQELASQFELREDLQLHGAMLDASTTGPERFMAWTQADPWLARRRWLIYLTRLLPLAMLVTVVLTTLRRVPPEPGAIVFLLLVLVSGLLSVFLSSRVHDIFTTVSTRNAEVTRYLDIFGLVHSCSATSPKLAALKQDLMRRGGGASRRLRELNRIMWLASVNRAPTKIIVYIPLQLFTLWDFHILGLLERWQQRHGHHVRFWFEALGQFEALCSLATLAHDNPHWTYPDVDGASASLVATGLGHPLIGDDVRVVNDVEIGPPETFLLVTGSNMSGKSTLLRSVGTNVVLAQAGGPVCADSLRMPPVALATSMRIRDSLADGVSFFMAELKRLKQIVDEAHALSGADGRRLLYLLDEVLQGTNSKERHIAVSRVIRHLLNCGAVGAVSTHDLELATETELSRTCRPVHFRETVHGRGAERPMTFDYHLRDGVATTTNALKLLEIIGLGNQ